MTKKEKKITIYRGFVEYESLYYCDIIVVFDKETLLFTGTAWLRDGLKTDNLSIGNIESPEFAHTDIDVIIVALYDFLSEKLPLFLPEQPAIKDEEQYDSAHKVALQISRRIKENFVEFTQAYPYSLH